jgi:hypothetical protein
MEKYFWDRWPGLFGHYMTRSALNSGIDPEWAKIAGDFSSGILLEGFMTITVNGVRAYKNLRTGEIVYGDTVLGSGIGSTTKGTKNGSGAIEQTGANAVKRTGTVTKPSELPDSNVRPKGNYAPNDTPGYIRQNESADLLSQNGYRVEMLDEVPGGNGYGIKETSNQDLLVESKVYDSYAPKAETSIKTIIRELSGKTKNQATNIILNLDDFVGDVDELITSIIQKATPSGDLKRLEDLKIIKDGKIINIFID